MTTNNRLGNIATYGVLVAIAIGAGLKIANEKFGEHTTISTNYQGTRLVDNSGPVSEREIYFDNLSKIERNGVSPIIKITGEYRVDKNGALLTLEGKIPIGSPCNITKFDGPFWDKKPIIQPYNGN